MSPASLTITTRGYGPGSPLTHHECNCRLLDQHSLQAHKPPAGPASCLTGWTATSPAAAPWVTSLIQHRYSRVLSPHQHAGSTYYAEQSVRIHYSIMVPHALLVIGWHDTYPVSWRMSPILRKQVSWFH